MSYVETGWGFRFSCLIFLQGGSEVATWTQEAGNTSVTYLVKCTRCVFPRALDVFAGILEGPPRNQRASLASQLHQKTRTKATAQPLIAVRFFRILEAAWRKYLYMSPPSNVKPSPLSSLNYF